MSGRLRCWPGALAIITRPGSLNEGRLVTVVREWRGELAADGSEYNVLPGLHYWIVAGRDLVLHTRDAPRGLAPWTIARDCYLRPILPPPSDKATPTETTAPAGVTAEV